MSEVPAKEGQKPSSDDKMTTKEEEALQAERAEVRSLSSITNLIPRMPLWYTGGVSPLPL